MVYSKAFPNVFSHLFFWPLFTEWKMFSQSLCFTNGSSTAQEDLTAGKLGARFSHVSCGSSLSSSNSKLGPRILRRVMSVSVGNNALQRQWLSDPTESALVGWLLVPPRLSSLPVCGFFNDLFLYLPQVWWRLDAAPQIWILIPVS